MRARERRWTPSSSWRAVSAALRLQPRASSERPPETVPASVRETVDAPGQPLDNPTRTFMEPRFGQDFSNVRVHTNDDAARSARDVNALAYTAGQNIAFASGQYAPSTSRGQRLIAHELAHVVQQRHAPAPDKDSISRPGDRDEIAADRTSAAALAGRTPEPAAAAAGADHALQRDPPPPGSLQQRSLPPDAGPAKLPEKPKGSDEAIAEALKKAYDDFSKTPLGKELEEHAKSYVFSLKGLPFDIFVVQGVAMIISTFDPKLPNVPDIELGNGITLKIEITGRASDLPPLMRQLVTGHHDPSRPIERDKAGQPTNETKVAVSVEFTWEALADFAAAVGRFFKLVAFWFARGVVKIGTIIARAGRAIGSALLAALGAVKHELIGAAIGGAIGASLGALSGVGAGLGLAVGAGVGLAFGGISHLLDRQRKKL
jgi:hypothetical protein